MPPPLPADQRTAIIDAVRSGASVRQAAAQFGVSVGVVAKLTRGLARERAPAPKKRADYDRARRLEVLNRAFTHALELLPTVTKPAQLQAWAVAVGVLIDKRRLEEGEVTARTEMVTADAAREELARRLDELAARRQLRRERERQTG
ncbi:MAG: hypothetical protein KatS3mg060_1178 [Dehalococcoidia bacterium]|nr:MAG: hypothetical protein KatS3mg060_1178 [Dehalococcoidia bacterium]